MPERPASAAFTQLRKFLAAQRDTRRTDAELMARFVAERDEAAFAMLVKRHGSMVQSICQAVLHQTQDAEDVCQATFLILAKKAKSIRKHTSLASWLHGVAHRQAQKLKTRRDRTPRTQTSSPPAADPVDELSWREVRQIVHEELERLPEKYRQPLILCCLEGATQEEAARQLGWSAGMLKGMLTRGRDLLRKRLTKRGLAMTAPLFVGALAPSSAGAIMARTTAHAAVQWLAGEAVSGGVTAQAVAIAKGGMKVMVVTKVKLVAALLLAAGLVGASAGLAAVKLGDRDQAVVRHKETPKTPQVVQVVNAKPQLPKEIKQPRVDLYGDPLPEGAVARIGTTRFLGANLSSSAFAYGAEGKLLLSPEGMKAVVLWDATTGQERGRLEVDGYYIYSFSLSPDGKTLATVGRPFPNIRIWDLVSRKQIRELTFAFEPVPTQPIMPPAASIFTPDGKTLAVFKGDGVIRRWDTATWQEKDPLPPGVGKFPVPGLAQSWPIPADYHFLPDGKTLISGRDNPKYGGISWWDITSGNRIRELDVKASEITVSPDGTRLAAVLPQREVGLWDTVTGGQVTRVRFDAKVDESAIKLCFSLDSQSLACVSRSFLVAVHGKIPKMAQLRAA